MIDIYALQVELKSSIDAFNNAISNLELETMELLDVILDSGSRISNNQDFLDWIGSAQNTFLDDVGQPEDEAEDQELPTEITSRVLFEEGACPLTTVEELYPVLELIFQHRVSVGLEMLQISEVLEEHENSCEGQELQQDYEGLLHDLQRGRKLVQNSEGMDSFFELLEDYFLDQA